MSKCPLKRIGLARLNIYGSITIFTLILTSCLTGDLNASNFRILTASWYDQASLIREGTWKNGKERKMANGEHYNPNRYSCATNLYNFGDRLRIRNMVNRKSVVCVVADRISKKYGKTRIDLTPKAFRELETLEKGIVKVEVERIV